MKKTKTWKAGLEVPYFLILSAEVTTVTETGENPAEDGVIIEGEAQELDTSIEQVEEMSSEKLDPKVITDRKAVK